MGLLITASERGGLLNRRIKPLRWVTTDHILDYDFRTGPDFFAEYWSKSKKYYFDGNPIQDKPRFDIVSVNYA